VRQIYREKYPEYTFLSDEELSKERRYVELLSKYDDYIPEEHIDIILNAHLDEEDYDYRRHLPRILPPHYNPTELYFVYDSIENDITVFWYVRNGILVITSWKKTREQYFV
jgi:hypothetical protein